MWCRVLVFLSLFFFFTLACSCSKNNGGEKDDYQPTDHDSTNDNAGADVNDDIPLDDSDVAGAHPPHWTVTEEEDIPWVKDGNGIVQYYQWGTTGADTPFWTEYWNGKLYVGGTTNLKFDQSTDADMYLKIVTDNKKVKTYRWGTDQQETVTGPFAFGTDDKLYILGKTTGDMGKVWGKSGQVNTDCVVTVLDTVSNAFSFIQWGNEKACEPRTFYLEDDGTLVVIGLTNSAFPGQTLHGKADIFISRIKGKDISTTQFGQQVGTSSIPSPMSAKTASMFYICGSTNASLPGTTFSGGNIDGFIIGIDRKTFEPTRYYQIGTPGDEALSGIAVAPDNKIHFIGSTSGTFAGFTSKGGMDFFYGHLENDTVVIDNMTGTAGDDYSETFVYYNDLLFHTGSTTGDCGGNDTRLSSNDIVLVALTADYKIGKCFHWGTSKVDSGGAITITPEGRLYIGARTYSVLGSQYFGDGSSDSWDAVLMTATLSELGL